MYKQFVLYGNWSVYRSLGCLNMFPVWLRNINNRLISGSLEEPVLCHTKKLYIASYYRPFSTDIKIKIVKSIHLGANKTGFILMIFHFSIRGKLSSIIRYDIRFMPILELKLSSTMFLPL